MGASTEIKDRMKRLDERLARYIPPRETWTPAEEVLFKPIDLYREPLEDARAMQLKAIKHTFTRHYKVNQFYQHCPVCDRPGPVLDSEVHRAPYKEVSGCSEELRRVLARTLQGGT